MMTTSQSSRLRKDILSKATVSKHISTAPKTCSGSTEVNCWKPEVDVDGWQSTIMSCAVRGCCHAITSEVVEDLVFAAVICRVCTLVKVS
jgi:hypothetical protein